MDYQELGNEELMGLYGLNDFSAFDELYQRVSGKFYGYILKKVADSEIAKEIIQKVFLKIHLHRTNFNPNKSFNAWAFTIINNEIIDFFRKKKLNIRILDEEVVSSSDQTFDFKEEFDIESFLEKLSKVEKEAVLLRYFKDLDFNQIGTVLGKTESNTRKIISRAILKIKNLIKSKG